MNRPENQAAPATLKDISERLNISVTSVHRALTGKDGISDSLRELILETAREMGYEKNYVASSIKRKTIRIAAILPQDHGLYYEYIWQGLRNGAAEARALNVEVDEYICDDEFQQAEIVEWIANQVPNQYAGVITFCFTHTDKVLTYQLLRLQGLNICTVLIDEERSEIDGIYVIPANGSVLGSVAAEFSCLITPERGTVLVSQGRTDSRLHINKIAAFREYIKAQKPGQRVVVVPGYSRNRQIDEQIYQNVLRSLRENPDTVLYYALTSADNKYVVRAVEELGMQDQVSIIATDLNKESAGMLRRGAVKAVINQGAYAKGDAAINMMVDCVVKHQEKPRRFDCPIDVVLRSNLCFYERTNR